MSRRRRRFLPGWWRFTESGPQWSPTAHQRIGVPSPKQPARDDFQLWEAEMARPQINPTITDDNRGTS